MVVGERLDLGPQCDKPWLVPIQLDHEFGTGVPHPGRVSINGREDVEKALDIDILQRDPSHLLKAGFTGRDIA